MTSQTTAWTRRQFLEGAGSGLAAAALPEPLPAESSKPAAPRPAASLSPVETAAGVLSRQLGPATAARFHLSLLPPTADGHPAYTLEASAGEVHLAGTTAAAICRGAYAFLREQCGAMITWSGSHLDLPTPLPAVAATRRTCPYRHVQYLNPCTFGYTTAFWDWTRWERELDWMALHGITMPLAMEGQEIIWQQVWRSFGLTDAEIDAFNTGPGHLPWHRMGNINHFDGPLPQHWMDERRRLQRQILDRMRALGMTPVAPAFAGFVPQGFLRVHPEAKTFTLLWLPDEFKTIPRSTRTFILHPRQTELFRDIGQRFIHEYKAEYGEVSYYLADTFNELAVPVRQGHRDEDLERFGRTIFDSIQAGDPNGTWVMQGWLFVYDSAFWEPGAVAAFLRGVPNDRMLILDYGNDLTPSLKGKYSPGQWKKQQAFFGKQWVNGMAHTFGGNNQIKGNLALMASEPAAVLASPDHGNLAGWGMCPEGIETNEVVYELMTDAGWQSEPIDLAVWIPAYCRSRYGACPESMLAAWQLLLRSAYHSHIWMTVQAWQTEPSFAPRATSVDAGPIFRQAVDLFLACAPQLGNQTLFRNDLIELVVQAAGGSVDQLLLLATQAFAAGEIEIGAEYGKQAVDWMLGMDALLHLRPDRRLETWVGAAKSYAAIPAEATYLDENARRLITTWGWPELSDYANRAWSGLTRDYYAARWQAWFDSQAAGAPFSLDLWQQSWLSSPYQPSPPRPVPDLAAACHDLLRSTLHVT